MGAELALELDVTLRGITPPIWRRLLVPTNTTLARIHSILQRAMGWQNCHLHQFIINDLAYGTYDPDGELGLLDARRIRLEDVVKGGSQFFYEYDFGDGWLHEIQVRAIKPKESGVALPRCIAGARACPPEDCGGVTGYQHLVDALQDTRHDDHRQMIEWLKQLELRFDPEAFDLDAIDRSLRSRR